MLAQLWRRRLLLIILVIVAVGASLPFALRGPTTFSSQGRAIIPSLPPTPLISELIRPSVIAIRLQAYLGGELEEDVRAELGEDADQLIDLVGVQQQNLFAYDVTVTTKNADTAEQAAGLAVERLIARADELSTEIVDQTTEAVQEAIEPIAAELADIREERVDIAARLKKAEKKLSFWKKRATNAAGFAKKEDSDKARKVAAKAEKKQDRFTEKAGDLQGKSLDLGSQISVLVERRNGLTNLAQVAEQQRLARLIASTEVTPPTKPEEQSITRATSTVTAAVIVGLVVGLAIVFFIDRKRILDPAAA